jgi:Domain of unknown function (DUF5122) beta-propeller
MRIFLRYWRSAIGLSGLCIASIAIGQNPSPAALPNLELRSNGSVFALATDPDGGVIVGGNFSYFAGQVRHNVARLFPNGNLDPNWHPDVNGIVTAIAVDASGSVYLGGDFTEIDGAPRTRLARIGFDGMLDANWNPAADNRVNALVVNGNTLFAGGFFNSIGGASRQFLAKLSTSGSGTVDASWDPSPSSAVYALALDGADKLFVGGRFAMISSANRALVARVSTLGVGAIDSFFASVCCNAVHALSVVGDDLFIGGDFINVGAAQRHYLAKLATANGAVDASWNPGGNDPVTALLWDGANQLYIGGFFTEIAGVSRLGLARVLVAGNGSLDAGWNPVPDGDVRAIAAEVGGGLFIGGGFRRLGNNARFGFAKLDASGSAAASVDAERIGFVSAIALDNDGGSIVGGVFRRANGQPRENLLRVSSSGNLDPTWAPLADQGVRSVAVDASGAIYAGGDFTSVSGVARGGLVKLARNGIGLPDANWNPGNSNGPVFALAVADNALFAAGAFTMIGNNTRTGLAKLSLNGTGAVDQTWNAAVDDTVEVLLPGPNSQLYIAGAFAVVGGTPRLRIARVSTVGSGALDLIWNPMPNNSVKAMSLQGNWLYLGGAFTGLGTEHFPRIARVFVSGNGTPDASWNPVALSDVSAILASNDGVYVAGAFDTIGGLPNRLHLARLDSANNGAADPNWNPIVDGIPYVIVDRGAQIEIGGSFNAVSNQTRIGIARLAKDSIYSNSFE